MHVLTKEQFKAENPTPLWVFFKEKRMSVGSTLLKTNKLHGDFGVKITSFCHQGLLLNDHDIEFALAACRTSYTLHSVCFSCFSKLLTTIFSHSQSGSKWGEAVRRERMEITYLWNIELVGPAFDAEVWVAFPNRQEAWALLCVALSFAAATGETFSAVTTALAKLQKEFGCFVQ